MVDLAAGVVEIEGVHLFTPPGEQLFSGGWVWERKE
jgi:hypothetical protein